MKPNLKLVQAIVFSLAISAAGCAFAQTNLMEMIQKPLSNSPAGEWWSSSWEKGYQYHHHASFELVCSTKLVPGADANWIDEIAAAQAQAGADLHVHGIANASTFTIEGSPNPVLGRYYEAINSDRELGARIKFLTPVAQEMHQWLFGQGQVRRHIASAIKWFSEGLKMFLIAHGMVEPTMVAGYSVGATVTAEAFGVKAEKAFQVQLKSAGLAYTNDGFMVDSNHISRLPFGDELGAVNNLAFQLSEGFRNQAFFIQSDEDSLKFARASSATINPFYEVVKGTNHDIRTIISLLPQPPDAVKAVLQRECYSMNNAIFNGAQRQKGEIWVIDGSVLSTFLHPDLKGGFRGHAVVAYEADETNRPLDLEGTTYTNRLTYSAKRLHIKLSAITQGGDKYATDLEYSEPDFTAKFNDQTAAYIYVDTENGMVREAILDFIADGTQSHLPKMPLTKGFIATGSARLQVRYMADRTKIDSAPLSQTSEKKHP